MPNHIVWAVVLPLCLMAVNTGRLPGLLSLEFWMIAYWGFYKKCWPDVAALLQRYLVG